jgi:hypothetical protein
MAKTAVLKKETPKSTAQQLGSIVKSCRDIMRKDKGLNGDLDRLPMLTWIMFLKFLDDMEQVREAEAKLAGKRYRPSIESPYRWRDWASKPEGITGPELIAFINQDEAVRPNGTRAERHSAMKLLQSFTSRFTRRNDSGSVPVPGPGESATRAKWSVESVPDSQSPPK